MSKTLFVAAVMSSVMAFAPAALAHGCYRHHGYHHSYKHHARKNDEGVYGSSKSMQNQPGAGGQNSQDRNTGASPDEGSPRNPSDAQRQGI